METTHSFRLSEPWFTLTKDGLKEYEGRLNTEKFKKIKQGDLIEYTCVSDSTKMFTTRVVEVYVYKTFRDMLVGKTIKKCLPGVNTIEDGVNVYRAIYTDTNEVLHGVVALRQEVVVL